MSLSLRRRLLLTLIPITAVVWLLSAYTSYRDTQHEVEELFDAQMAQTARTLLSVAGHELMELTGAPLENTHIHFGGSDQLDIDGHKYEYKLAYQLWQQPENRLLMRSFTAPEEPLTDKPNGYNTRQIRGEPWRVFSLLDRDSGFQVQVGEAMAIREELTNAVALRTGLPLLIALPLLALFISVGVTRTLSPLKQLARVIARRDPNNLEAVAEQNVPQEISPLVEALNRLFTRLSRAFENERRFTADAAHELRTPLAALKVQAQVARRSHDEAEREQALSNLLEGVDRAAHLVEQLLILARIDPQNSPAVQQRLDLGKLAEEAVIHAAGQATAKQIELTLDRCPDPRILGIAEGITILLRNLLENAIRYTPQGGRVQIAIEQEDAQHTTLRIADSGPGIPAQKREKIFERFYRLAGQQTSGSGLGLSIVKRIAELNHAELTLDDSPLGGLEVRVRFLREQG
ncbi:MAG: ATP-binding protein [Gammaproteobacteria bacterium]|nr:ATP-binding protein [Gammaproteobacteria bacterium]MCW8841368.1 ATP-binding protein [Gammaproteobacteria bacterium]MCW8927619.1 ATP-binding protein [Gammaproteobacteria bacterium]MCW8972878.1 ATP-binding protein [Gammaproteobacteria bacterium]MCW8993477.1 ATP-binding protein [Gammaproteobacteria bacterium]